MSTSAARRVRFKPRYATQLKVDVFSKGLEHRHVDKTANISEGGLFLCTDLKAEMGEKIHIRVILSDQDAYFDVKTVVAWICDGDGSHPQGLGLEFIEVNEAQQRVIDEILKAYVNVQSNR